MFSPAEVANNVIGIGKNKVSYKAYQLLLLGFMAGAFIALAAVGANTAGVGVSGGPGKLISACIFPTGLAMVLVAGSELFTGNCLIIVGVLEKQVTWGQMFRNWVLVYIGNFIGSIFVAYVAYACGQFNALPDAALAATTIKVATGKASLTFGAAVMKGMMCNFLVCIAVWISFAAKTVAGKIVGLYLPIMLFVLSGYEHSVANMYYVPAGLFAKMNETYAAAAVDAGVAIDNLTWGNFFINNLIPVTIGNIIGGMILVGCVYWAIYLMGKKKDA